MLKQIQPVLPSRDVDAAIDFYVNRLGFRLAFHAPQHPAYAVICRDSVELHLQWSDQSQWALGDRPMVRFLVSEIDQLFEEYQTQGVFHEGTVLGSTPWGTREFAFYDLDGNGLTFYCVQKSIESKR